MINWYERVLTTPLCELTLGMLLSLSMLTFVVFVVIAFIRFVVNLVRDAR